MKLPAAVSLEQLRKQAKDLREARSLKLSEAQFEIARRYGFPSWPRLRAYVDRVATAGGSLQHAFEDDPGYYGERADGLLASATDGTPDAVAAFERWAAPPTTAGARLVVTRNHGFTSWAALRKHVGDLRAEPFPRAFAALRERDLDGLRALLARFPELVTAVGTNGNDLLGLASATCDERLVAVLLEAGADVAHGNAHGWTALHQAGYSNLPHLARVLLDAGAPVDVPARGDGGTPLAAALFWGNREVAAVLAGHGVVPRNLRVAAGLDDVALVTELWSSPGAGAHRGFYRPHGGFPAWRPSDSVTEVRDEAMSWAARADAVGAITALHRLGASLDANVYRGTPLVWAAARGRVAAVRLLLSLGAAPSVTGTFGGPRHGVGTTALHHAAESGHLAVIEALLDAGADPTIADELYGGTPANWAAHGGHEDARALLLRRGGTERT
ncbi:MAG TPA: ankyrin repeat domain-containing protein [Actinophytocola sp.]|nr:ankyrin repeat domain-containing protein [Actinophytocola sp.]